jgi:hypothetical protein
LHLNAPPVSGKAYLVTPSKVSSAASWKFMVQMDFNPSSSNYSKIFLMSNTAKIDSSLQGYYLKIGSGDDDMALYRQNGTISQLIVDGRDDMLDASANKLRIQITRSAKGEWSVFADTTGQTNYSLVGSAIDTSFWISNYFGVQAVYTSTRSTKFKFDDFEVSGKISTDTVPPKVFNWLIESDSVVSFEFSEAINTASLLNKNNYRLPTGSYVSKTYSTDNKKVSITISPSIPCLQNLPLTISGLTDLSENIIADTSFQLSYCPGEIYDVVISEIMADPDPLVHLPNSEYLEFTNRSNSKLNLGKWSLQIGEDKIYFPDVELPADSILIVTIINNCPAFKKPGACLEILSTNSLNNSGEYLGLKNKSGKLIHWVNYSDKWYGNLLKEDGGWSLEMIDLESPCLGSSNWNASNNSLGGSPGEINAQISSNPDIEKFSWKRIGVENDSVIRVYFSKPVNNQSLSPDWFTVDGGYGHPMKTDIDPLEHLYVDLGFSWAFLKNRTYSLEISDKLSDCSNVPLQQTEVVSFGVPSVVEAGDVLVNEVLFNSFAGGSEFVEIYNNSDKFITSEDIKFAYSTTPENYTGKIELGDSPFIIAPHSFLVLTSNSNGVAGYYNVSDERLLLEIRDFPALNNSEGCIALLSSDLNKIDEFCYSEKAHSPLLATNSGVSLERIRYDEPAKNTANWNSAASTEGYATPGYQNSQYLSPVSSEEEVYLEEEIFSPDNDGFKDIQTLHYKLDKSGYVGNIMVFDALGRKIKTLANNMVLGTEGLLLWNGLDDKGQLAPTGIYLFYAELHHSSGEVKKYKKACVLGMQTNR